MNVSSRGVGDTLESLVGVASGRVGLVDEGLDGSGGTVDGGAGLSGVVTSDGGVLGNLLDSVLADSLGDNVESLGLGSLGSVDGDGGTGLRLVESTVLGRPGVNCSLFSDKINIDGRWEGTAMLRSDPATTHT